LSVNHAQRFDALIGSGKSALVKMMAGETIPTRGMCYIGKSSLIKNRKEYLSSIGYCSQSNTLFDNFTGIQMLTLIGRLRGIPETILQSHVAKWLMIFGEMNTKE
jgi:ABC-type multidrug transport system ATPase subunit